MQILNADLTHQLPSGVLAFSCHTPNNSGLATFCVQQLLQDALGSGSAHSHENMDVHAIQLGFAIFRADPERTLEPNFAPTHSQSSLDPA